MDEFDHVFDTHAAVPNPVDEVRSDALYRVDIPRQNLIVRLNGLWPDIPEDEFLPAVRPYGILRMAWAIWREVPGVAPKGAFSFAFRVRRKGEVEVLIATRFLAEQIRLGLRARHHLVSRVERAG